MPEEFDPTWEYREGPDDENSSQETRWAGVLECADSFQFRRNYSLTGGGGGGGAVRLGPRKPARPAAKTFPPTRCAQCKRLFKPTAIRKYCGNKCRAITMLQAKCRIADRRARMVLELFRVYGTLRAAACEADVPYTSASRALKRIGWPVGGNNVCNRKEGMFNGLTFNIEQAKSMVLRGARFGDVYPGVPELDRPEFREWFVRNPGDASLSPESSPQG